MGVTDAQCTVFGNVVATVGDVPAAVIQDALNRLYREDQVAAVQMFFMLTDGGGAGVPDGDVAA